MLSPKDPFLTNETEIHNKTTFDHSDHCLKFAKEKVNFWYQLTLGVLQSSPNSLNLDQISVM